MVSLATLALALGGVVGLFDRLVGRLVDRSSGCMQCVTSLLLSTAHRKEGLETVTFLFWIDMGNHRREEWTDGHPRHGKYIALADCWRRRSSWTSSSLCLALGRVRSPSSFLFLSFFFFCSALQRNGQQFADITYLGRSLDFRQRRWFWFGWLGRITGFTGLETLFFPRQSGYASVSNIG